MFWRVRSYWLAAGAVAYVAFAALRGLEAPAGFAPRATMTARALAWLSLLGLPVALAVVWTLTAPPTRGEDHIDEGARRAARACFAGAAILLAARAGLDTPGFVALANLGAAIASMAALVALARITAPGGLVEPPASARRLDAAAFASLLWTIAVALPAARSLAPVRFAGLEPIALDLATAAASIGSLGLCLAPAARVLVARRFELGVADRASAALLLAIAALAIGLGAAAASVSSPERLLPFVVVVAGGAIAVSTSLQEPTSLARALRVTLSLATLAAPIALVAVVLTQAAPSRAGAVVFVACAACALAGLAAPAVSRRLAPQGSRWLAALDAATRAAMEPDPDAALEAALLALRSAAARGAKTADAAAPALFRVTGPRAASDDARSRGGSAEVITVDRAGYAHVDRAELPAQLVELAEHEPLFILRAEVARAVEVRRPELRPIVAWLDQRGFCAAALVRDDMSSIGLLGIPSGGRTSPMTIEEVRALRALADRLGAVIGASASLARSRDRELAARAEVERLSAETRRLVATMDRDAGRLQAIARMLERPARVACYSPAARAAVEHLERLAETGRPVTLLTAPGVDAVAWSALAHLASPRRSGPLTIVDGASPTEHDLARWRAPDESPLRASTGGTIVLVDAHALPPEVQSYVGAAITDDLGLVVSVPSTIDALVAVGRMSERLADRLGDRAVALPTLASRAEDFRALAIEHLARIGIRLQSRPLGLDPRALAALLEHAWPGNDAELYATLLRAALVTEGDVIRPADLERIGFTTGTPDASAGRASTSLQDDDEWPVAADRRRGAPRAAEPRVTGAIPIARRKRQAR